MQDFFASRILIIIRLIYIPQKPCKNSQQHRFHFTNNSHYSLLTAPYSLLPYKVNKNSLSHNHLLSTFFRTFAIDMKTRLHSNIFILFVAMLIGIATTSVLSCFTTEYAEIICKTIDTSEQQNQEKSLFTQISALDIQISTNQSKLPTITSHNLAKRVSQHSALNTQLIISNNIIHNILRENSWSHILSYSHRTPLYYIFALHRMRN